jgi:hypothetical protein
MSAEENKDNNSSQSHIHIFGEEIDSRRFGGSSKWDERDKWREERECHKEEWRNNHPHHHGSMLWGLLILLVGVILLLNGFGLISHAFWVALVPFWPVILIIWGLDILLGRTSVGRILVALVAIALCVVVIVYGLAKVDPVVANSLPPSVNSLIMQPQQIQININK